MAPAPSLKELKQLVKDFYSKIPKKSSKKAELHKFADEMGLTQIESKVAEVSNKVVKKNQKDLLKPNVNLLPDNTHQAPSLPLKPKSDPLPKKTSVSKPENLHNYKNLHAKSHKTVIVPGFASKHLEDAQHQFRESQKNELVSLLLKKHLSEELPNLKKMVDTKRPSASTQTARKAETAEVGSDAKPEMKSSGQTAKPEAKSMGSQANEGTLNKLKEGREKYQSYINALKAGGMSHADAIAQYKVEKKSLKKGEKK